MVGHRYCHRQKKSHTLSGKCWKHISHPAVERSSKTGNNLGINMNHDNNGIQHTEYKHNPWVHTELKKGAGAKAGRMRLDFLYKTMPANVEEMMEPENHYVVTTKVINDSVKAQWMLTFRWKLDGKQYSWSFQPLHRSFTKGMTSSLGEVWPTPSSPNNHTNKITSKRTNW